jgi:NAD(P)-dependent dehydrogenase (short-subunit alcohol dehydrogenase family)
LAGNLVITGGGRGIGAATARLAAKRGYAVAINYVGNRAAADRVVAEIASAGGRAIAVQGDVANEADVRRLFETAERELGALGGLVNNAGITGMPARVEDLGLAELERILAVNVVGTVLCAREAVRRLSTKHGGAGGGIVNVSSMAATMGGANQWVAYAAAKGAVNSFTIGLAREVAAEGIRVNAVSPGLIDTEIHAAAGIGDRLEKLTPTVPMQRIGSAEEVAEAILWLLSGEAAYTIGTIINISGGR